MFSQNRAAAFRENDNAIELTQIMMNKSTTAAPQRFLDCGKAAARMIAIIAALALASMAIMAVFMLQMPFFRAKSQIIIHTPYRGHALAGRSFNQRIAQPLNL